MRYQQPTFTLPTVNKRMAQTDYEIAVGLRNPDGSLRQSKRAHSSDDRPMCIDCPICHPCLCDESEGGCTGECCE